MPTAPPLILIAEGNLDDQRRFTELLTDRGYAVLIESNATNLLDVVRTKKPDLVLLDIHLPNGDGLQLCACIKAQTVVKFLPVILVTEKTDLQERVQGLKQGADDYLCKPIDGIDLAARIEALLRIKKLHDRICRSKVETDLAALTDPLTGLYNLAYLAQHLKDEFAKSEKYFEPLACILVSLDDYLFYTNELGRALRDQLVREFAALAQTQVREFDIITRTADDRFGLLLPRTHFTGSVTVATRLRKKTQSSIFLANTARPTQACLSLGLSFFPNKDVTSPAQLLDQAERALTFAQNSGRNQICLFQHTTYLYKPETE